MSGLLRQQNPNLDVIPAFDINALGSAVAAGVAGVRVVAFLSSVIVPAEILGMLDGPAYNFHPGPPEYPGSYVAGFAIYDGAETFGVTLHEMSAQVDAGPENAKFQDLEIVAFQQVLTLFEDYASHMACNDAPLPSGIEPWTGTPHTRAEAERLMQIEADLTEEEIVRRYRAFG